MDVIGIGILTEIIDGLRKDSKDDNWRRSRDFAAQLLSDLEERGFRISRPTGDSTDLRERIALCKDFTLGERDLILDALSHHEHDRARRSRPTAYLDPGNYLGRIEHIWAFLSVDEGGEGVCAAPMGELPAVPLIAADEARLESLQPLARQIANVFGKPVQLAKFTSREDVETIMGVWRGKQ